LETKNEVIGGALQKKVNKKIFEYNELTLCQKIKFVMKEVCCLRSKSNVKIKSFEKNKKFINSRLDIVKLIKIYDQIDYLQSILIEEDQSHILRHLANSLPGGFEIDQNKKQKLKILYDNIKIRRNSIDQKILSIFEFSGLNID
jgi:hypothetical protein